MRGGAILLTFFTLFAVASYAVPIPLFPGNLVSVLGVNVPAMYVPLVSAIVNGLVYGVVVWLVFVLISRRFEEPKVNDVKRGDKRSNKRS